MESRHDAVAPVAGRRTLGVVGTFVLDRIVGLPGRPGSSEGLGGIAYTLAGAVAAAPTDWSVLPVARVGSDALPAVSTWLEELSLATYGLDEVPELNNRVELRYRDEARRTEHLTGGVGGWPVDQLASAVADCDALLINFISGHELDLATVLELRTAFPGHIYADLHSLFLGTADDGTRLPRALPEWQTWVSCFDAVQLNEDEMALLGEGTDSADKASHILRRGPRLVACTRGADGVQCWVRDDGRIVSYEIAASPVAHADPTGCGDVWAGVMCLRLHAGDSVGDAAAQANRLAAVAARQSGVAGLSRLLEAEARTKGDAVGSSGGTDVTSVEEDN